MSNIPKVTTPNMTIFEYTRLLSARAVLLEKGAEPKIEWNGLYDPIAIAKEEIKQRVIPLVIHRKIYDNTEPSGFRVEEWDINDMDISDF